MMGALDVVKCFFVMYFVFFFFKQKTAYEMRISDWSSDVCSSDLPDRVGGRTRRTGARRGAGRCGAGDRMARTRAGALARCAGFDAGNHARRRTILDSRHPGGMEGPMVPDMTPPAAAADFLAAHRSEEHTSELQSLLRI